MTVPAPVRGLLGNAYRLYAVGLTLIAAIVLWPVVVTLPFPQRFRFWAVRVAERALGRCLGVPLTISGQIDHQGPVVVVANHSSVIDGGVLIAALGKSATFAVGSVFEHRRIVGRFLNGLGCIFVGGGTPGEAAAVTERLATIVASGATLVIFPEGHVASPGEIGRFRLGAFRAAADAGAPIVPVGIAGTDSIVAPRSRRVRRGPIRVTFGSPMRSEGSDWHAVIELRNAAQVQVAALSGAGPCGPGRGD
jgi:1-acyl-sn-glycerol-3-phosphate acyltransferase